MKKKTLKLKGLRTPRVFIFAHCFFDGRFKTVAIDPDSNLMHSAYINNKMFLFNEFCKRRIIVMENDLSSLCTEAEILLMELTLLDIPKNTPETPPNSIGKVPSKPPSTSAEAQILRATARAAAQVDEDVARSKQIYEEAVARYQKIIQRLVEIRDQIKSSELIANEELAANAEALKGRLCTYAHGALLKPVYTRYIPGIEYTRHFEEYRKSHDDLKHELANVIKERGIENV